MAVERYFGFELSGFSLIGILDYFGFHLFGELDDFGKCSSIKVCQRGLFIVPLLDCAVNG
jgi:hypothetical protein